MTISQNAEQQAYAPGPSTWDTHPQPPAGTGTPLGRIVLGVFLGLLAWSIFALIALFLMLLLVIGSLRQLVEDVAARALGPGEGVSLLSTPGQVALDSAPQAHTPQAHTGMTNTRDRQRT